MSLGIVARRLLTAARFTVDAPSLLSAVKASMANLDEPLYSYWKIR